MLHCFAVGVFYHPARVCVLLKYLYKFESLQISYHIIVLFFIILKCYITYIYVYILNTLKNIIITI